jgi:hypothetical protein
MVSGGSVRLYYQPAGCPVPQPAIAFQLPYLRCSVERYRELGLQVAGPLVEHTFRIVRDYGEYLDLEWET